MTHNVGIFLMVMMTLSAGSLLAQDSEIDAEIVELAISGVESNAEWEPFIQKFDGIEMMLVPTGCFMMGSENGDSDERPVHEQCFDEPFWIDRTEVTQADFERLNGQKASDNGYGGANRPVDHITWFEARDFCELREARLPTEREWEYAARGPDGLVYPWENEWDQSQVVGFRISSEGTADVGSIPTGGSWVGALDMSGNVWEWVSTIYDLNSYSSEEAGEDNNTDRSRVLRGGSWGGANSVHFRAANRSRGTPNDGNDYWGFRCARSF